MREIKKSALAKYNQGDVRIYKINNIPTTHQPMTLVKDPVLVYGNSGNHHKVVGDVQIFKDTKDNMFLSVLSNSQLTHEQHVPPIDLSPGAYLVCRAREKGVLDDMVRPVED